MLRFLHTADLHLDSPFQSMRDAASAGQRRAELNGAFLDMLQFAKEHQVSVVLIAGDLFDNDLASISLFAGIVDQMGKAEGIRFFIAPGNHDYYHEESLYALTPMPENVTVFHGETTRVDLLQEQVSIYGAGFDARFAEQSMLSGFHAEEGRTGIMVLHGDLAAESRYDPVSEADIRESGLAYLALGHVHRFSGIRQAGTTQYAYPGCPMGRGFDELGPKGFILGTVENGAVQAEFVPLGGREYRIEELDCTDCSLTEEIARKVEDRIDIGGNRHLYRFLLRGRTEQAPDVELMNRLLEGKACLVELRDETERTVDFAAVAEERSLRGVFVKQMLQRIDAAQGAEKEACRMALELGWKELQV